jgi:hypothetical protein
VYRQTNGWEDMTKLIITYNNFMKEPKNYYNFILIVQFSINASVQI